MPLLETTVDWLTRYLKRRMLLFHEQGSNVLFPSTKTGQVMDISTLWRIIKKYAQQACLDDGFTVHTLRHAFASHILATQISAQHKSTPNWSSSSSKPCISNIIRAAEANNCHTPLIG